MKKLLLIPMLLSLATLAACNLPDDPFKNPGDNLGGGGIADYTPDTSQSENYGNASDAAGEAEKGKEIPETVSAITEAGKISKSGDYVIEGELVGKINVKAENVHLYLKNAHLSNDKKVIESDHAITITLIGENSVTNTDGSNAIDCAGDLTINGDGSLEVNSTKNAIKGNSIYITECTLDITATSDGLHAEIDKYDDLTEAPVFSYSDGGFVYIDGADITINSTDDGIQADTFVIIKGDSNIDITTNGGAPQNITEYSSDNGDGKGIKAGAIDWGADDNEITVGDYLIAIESGNITVNSNDDAIHSDSEIVIGGGTLNITAGDDAIHAENLLTVSGGDIKINRCYEGLEAAKVEISGGKIDITAVDDGINAADGTENRVGVPNNNCHIVISGGHIYVNAEGDGIDSNGSMLISGGVVYVAGPSRGGNAALDADGNIIVNGGYLFAVGPIGMVETPASNSQQNVVSFARNSAIAAGTNISITDKDGTAIFSFTSPKSCQSVIISCPELLNGESYAIYGGDSSLCSFTVTQTITTVGSSGGIGNPGGNPPGGTRPGGPFGR